MMLVTKDLAKKLPKLYSTENFKDPLVICKFFLPYSRLSWYAIEFDGSDLFFGYVTGEFPELGYFSLSELENVRGVFKLEVERDLYFDPIPLSKLKSANE